jgi:hypothetical protein
MGVNRPQVSSQAIVTQSDIKAYSRVVKYLISSEKFWLPKPKTGFESAWIETSSLFPDFSARRCAVMPEASFKLTSAPFSDNNARIMSLEPNRAAWCRAVCRDEPHLIVRPRFIQICSMTENKSDPILPAMLCGNNKGRAVVNFRAVLRSPYYIKSSLHSRLDFLAQWSDSGVCL